MREICWSVRGAEEAWEDSESLGIGRTTSSSLLSHLLRDERPWQRMGLGCLDSEKPKEEGFKRLAEEATGCGWKISNRVLLLEAALEAIFFPDRNR